VITDVRDAFAITVKGDEVPRRAARAEGQGKTGRA
jgi:hypothetical protein